MALFDYPGGEEGGVSFVKGDIIVNQTFNYVLIAHLHGWMSGTVLRTGESGLVPCNLVQQVKDCVIVLNDPPVEPEVLLYKCTRLQPVHIFSHNVLSTHVCMVCCVLG